jgi:glycosyltransferase involved in cell wall biosynthesis
MGKVSIIIPVYNEESFITQTLDAVSKANILNFRKEIIIVDDGSNDGTKDAIKKFLNKVQPLSKIEFKTIFSQKNAGKGASVKKGFLISTGDIVIIQDADLEYSPEDYPLLLEPFIKHAADVVYGSRFISNRPHRVLYFWHYMTNKFLTSLSNMLVNLNLTDMETGFKVFRGEIIRQIAPRLTSKKFGFEPEITARVSKIKGIKIYEVGISYYGRTYEEGKKIGWLDGLNAVWEIFKYNLFTK